MIVNIKNKLVSLGGSSKVTNENDEEIFRIKGKIISPTKKKKMYDKDGNLLYIIRNKYWHFWVNRVFIFDAEKNRVATIKKNKWSINANYQIEDCDDEMMISGKFFGRTSKILKNGKEIATITRDITLFVDSFTLEANENDIPFLTALVIAFDNIKDKRQKDND